MQQGSATRSLARRQHEPWETAPLGIVAGDTGAGEAGQWPRPAYAWYVVAILLLAMTLAFVDRYVLSLLVEPIKAELRVSDTQIGLLQGVPFGIFYAIFGVPLGRLADQRNRRNLLAACVLLWSLFTAACGLAKGYALLFVARIGVAIGGRPPPTTMSLIGDYFPGQRTKPFGLFMRTSAAASRCWWAAWCCSGSSRAAAGAAAQQRGGWRVAFVSLGLPGLLCCCCF
jgi:MFS family permease